MKFKLLSGGLSIENDAQAMENLIDRITTITRVIELFNESDWQPNEVAMWLQYEKDLALIESKLYAKQPE